MFILDTLRKRSFLEIMRKRSF